ncbi:T9SS type A sorting domain-containing protein [candidate division TA06 bacterium]|nr:T9SS type A sorting domain-containing protein [candidate division TA06 bacterium]
MRHLRSVILLALAVIAGQALALSERLPLPATANTPGVPVFPLQRPGKGEAHKKGAHPARHKKPIRATKSASSITAPAAKGVVAPEFKMNTDSLPFNLYRYDLAAALLEDGSIVSVWSDYRSGWQKLYCQRFAPDGQKLGPVFLADDKETYQNYPAIAASPDGGFVLSWLDYRSWSSYDVYCRRFDASGNPLDTAFRVDDYDGGDKNEPSLTATDSGYAVTWNDDRSGDGDVYLQMIDSLGHLKGTNVRVNGVTSQYQYRSTAARTAQGFVVVWEDTRTGGYNIYARRYNSNGDTLGPEFKVNDNSTSGRYYPEACGTDSGFTVTWYDGRNSICDVYLQRYDTAGAAAGANYRVTDGTGWGFYPTIAHRQGWTVLSWYDDRSGDSDIYAQWFKPNGDTLGGQVLVSDDATGKNQYIPKALAGDSGWAFLWFDQREKDISLIYGQAYDASLSAVTPNFMACDSVAGVQDQYDATVTAGQDGKFLAVWYDRRNGDGSGNVCDIYGRLYDQDGNALTPDFLISDTSYNSNSRYAYEPKVAGLADGSYLVAWYDYRSDNDYDIYGQRLDASGGPVGGNHLISTGHQGSEDYELSIASADSGYGVFWYGDKYSDYDIFGRIYKTNGDSVGPVVLVSDDSMDQDQEYPCAAANDSGLVVAWEDYRDGSYNHIYGQRMRWDGSLAGGNYLISDSVDYDEEDVSIAGSDHGFLATWDDNRAGNYNVYGRYLNAAGQPEDSSFAVSNVPAIDQYCASVAASPDGGRYAVYWNGEDSDYNDFLFSQRYQDRLPQGVNELLADSANWSWFYIWGAQNMAASDDRLFFALCGSMKGTATGWDVYGMVTDWYSVSVPPVIWVDSLPDDIDSAYGPYTVKSKITDDGSVDQAVLYYRINGGAWDTLAMAAGAADTFSAVIPAQSLVMGDTINISYYVWALDDTKNFISSPARSFKLTYPTGVAGQPGNDLPKIFALQPCRPNPSSGRVSFGYQLPKTSNVSLTVYNIAGQAVKRFDLGVKPAGQYKIDWNGNQAAAGVYFYRLQAGDFVSTKKLMIVK